MLFTPAVLLVPEKPAIMAEARPQIIRPDAPRLVLPATFLPFPMAMIGAGKPAAFSTWNSADKSANITLSGGNLIATASNTVGAVRGTSAQSSGKLYFEQTLGGAAGDFRLGMATASASLSASLGEDANGWGFGRYIFNGRLRNNATTAVSTTPKPADGDVVGFHVDFSALKFYIRINGTNWNSMDPAAGTGGQTFASGSWFPAFSSDSSSDSSTLNVGASAFGTSPASGYSAWG